MKPIPTYEELYSITKDGKVYSHKKERFLTQAVHQKGYKMVRLHRGHQQKNYLVHRLVALTYLAEDPDRPFVNHKDCNKQNNHVDNLEWCTRRENMLHAVNLGVNFGNRSAKKLDEDKVREMRKLHSQQDISYDKLAEMYEISLGLAWGIVNHTRWRHVT